MTICRPTLPRSATQVEGLLLAGATRTFSMHADRSAHALLRIEGGPAAYPGSFLTMWFGTMPLTSILEPVSLGEGPVILFVNNPIPANRMLDNSIAGAVPSPNYWQPYGAGTGCITVNYFPWWGTHAVYTLKAQNDLNYYYEVRDPADEWNSVYIDSPKAVLEGIKALLTAMEVDGATTALGASRISQIETILGWLDTTATNIYAKANSSDGRLSSLNTTATTIKNDLISALARLVTIDTSTGHLPSMATLLGEIRAALAAGGAETLSASLTAIKGVTNRINNYLNKLPYTL